MCYITFYDMTIILSYSLYFIKKKKIGVLNNKVYCTKRIIGSVIKIINIRLQTNSLGHEQ